MKGNLKKRELIEGGDVGGDWRDWGLEIIEKGGNGKVFNWE